MIGTGFLEGEPMFGSAPMGSLAVVASAGAGPAASKCPEMGLGSFGITGPVVAVGTRKGR